MIAKLKIRCASVLLRALNSTFLNPTPCQYEYVGNVDAFSRRFLGSSEQQQSGITVKQILDDADMFKACPISKNGLTVIEPDGTTHEATVWDRHELNIALVNRRGKSND
jgi:hypothetical protein